MQGQADSMVTQYGDRGLQLLIVIGATDSFIGGTPTPEYCQALQATQLAHVLYDPNGQVTGVLNIRINMGAAVIDGNGLWVTNPVGDESFMAAFSSLFSLFGFGR